MLRRWCIPLAGLALVIGSVAATAPAAAAGAARRAHGGGRASRQAHHPPDQAGRNPADDQPRFPARHVARTGPGTRLTAASSGASRPAGPSRRATAAAAATSTPASGSASTAPAADRGADRQRGGLRWHSPRYFAWYEMFPAFPVNFSNRVRPGDHFSASVTHNRRKQVHPGYQGQHPALEPHRSQVAPVARRTPRPRSSPRHRPPVAAGAAPGRLRHDALQQRQGERFRDEPRQGVPDRHDRPCRPAQGRRVVAEHGENFT